MIHVPYKGGGPSVIALLSGEVAVSFASMPSAIGHIRAGKLRALAVTTAQRTASVPDLPTISEAGVPGYAAETWLGLAAPAATPKAIIDQLHAAAVQTFTRPEVKERLEGLGYVVRLSSPEEYGRYVRSEIDKWRKVVQAAHIRAD